MTRLRDLVARAARPDVVAIELGVLLTACGLLFLGVGWQGVARLLAVPLQFPYAVSGGLGGLSLVGLGLAVIEIQSSRRDRARDRDDLDELAEKAAGLLRSDGRG